MKSRTALLALLLTAACTTTAHAAVPGLQLVTKTSAIGSQPSQGELALCPNGKRAIGGGARVIGGAGEVVLDDMRPESGFGFTALGREDANGFAGTWFAEASAICANPIPGLQVITKTTPPSSINKAVSAVCPADKFVVGGGAELNTGTLGNVTLNTVRPAGNSYDANARELPAGNPDNWSLTAHVVCADHLPGLEYKEATSPTDSFANKTAAATCSPGKKLIGGGGQVVNGNGSVILKGMAPNGASLTSMLASAEEVAGGLSGDWRVRAFAICATP